MAVQSDDLDLEFFFRKMGEEMAKGALEDPRKLVTRRQLAAILPHRRLREADFDDDVVGGTGWRTFRDPALP